MLIRGLSIFLNKTLEDCTIPSLINSISQIPLMSTYESKFSFMYVLLLCMKYMCEKKSVHFYVCVYCTIEPPK